jgi:transcriptional regulator with XRE-family HTH domain
MENNIHRIRKRCGLYQKQLADTIGTTQPYLSRIENGIEDASIQMYKKIADALDVPLWKLFE